jgi:large subunit ribosomal protein L17
MKKHVFGRKFKRDKNERKALFKNLLTELVLHEQIKTTEEKAKAIKGDFDKLVTIAKKGGQVAYRRLESEVNADAAKKLVAELAERTKGRTSGYTRIVKLGRRFNDDAMVVLMELVDKKVVVNGSKETTGTKEKESVEATASVETETPKKTTKKTVKKAATKKKSEEKTK